MGDWGQEVGTSVTEDGVTEEERRVKSGTMMWKKWGIRVSLLACSASLRS